MAYTIDGKRVTPDVERLLLKMTQDSPQNPVVGGDANVTAEQAVRLMNRSSLEGENMITPADAALVPSLSQEEFFKLAEVFRQHFPQSFPPVQKRAQFFTEESRSTTQIELPRFPELVEMGRNRSVEAIDLATGGTLTQVKVSNVVLEEVQASYNHERETGYLLFANRQTGVIEIAIPSSEIGSKMAIGYGRGEINYYKAVLEKEGYLLVGEYHSHTRTPEETKAYAFEQGYDFFDESFLSEDDQGNFDKVNQMDQVKLLGATDTQKGYFKIRGFIRLTERVLGNDAPLLKPEVLDRLNAEGRLVKHYKPHKVQNNYELDLVAVDSKVNPSGAGLLARYAPYEREMKRAITYDDYLVLCRLLTIEPREQLSGTGVSLKNVSLSLVVSRRWDGTGEVQVTFLWEGQLKPVLSFEAYRSQDNILDGNLAMGFFAESIDPYSGSMFYPVKPNQMQRLRSLLGAFIPPSFIFDLK